MVEFSLRVALLTTFAKDYILPGVCLFAGLSQRWTWVGFIHGLGWVRSGWVKFSVGSIVSVSWVGLGSACKFSYTEKMSVLL